MAFDRLTAGAWKRRQHGACGRYAPSPSGPLHLGNARTALVAWLQARLAGARFVLRMEDLDLPRVRAGGAQGIVADLKWLGLDWDEGPGVGGEAGPYNQSERTAIYAQALERLCRTGRAFECFCSRKDVQDAASAPHRLDRMPTYPGTCRRLNLEQRARKRKEQDPSWRFCADRAGVAFSDLVCGDVTEDLSGTVGDFVIKRGDGLFAYQLAVAVDDAVMGVTDVVRGTDLLDSTPRQIAVLEALDLPVPRYWHVPLMCDQAGRRMAKRDGSESIAAFRERGGRPEQLVGHLAAALNLLPYEQEATPQALQQALDLSRLRHALINAHKRVTPDQPTPSW